MSSKKLKRRLDAITKAFEAQGIGTGFCDCPNSEAINAKRIIARRLFPEIEYYDESEEVCESHKPRPIRKPETLLGDILRRVFPNFPPWIQEEEGFATPLGSSFAEVFVALPLETRLERLFGENGGPEYAETEEPEPSEPLRPSRFDMSEYQLEN